MKTTKTTRWLPALLALALILTACPNPAGSDDPLPLLTPPTPTVTSVTITPAKVSIAKGKSRNFTATVIGTNNPSQAVTWTIVFDGMYDRETTITEDGRLDIASDETADTTFMVKATSKANVSKWGTATVTVYATEADIPKTVENVTVAPVGTTVTKGQTHQFSATVEGTKLEAADKNVTWTVAPQNTGTGIDTTGMLTVAANDPATTLTVTATSVFDPTMSGFVTVTLAGHNPGYLGNRLELSGQVYTGGLNPADFSISYQHYNGSLDIVANNGGGNGSITGGQLTYSIGTPNSLHSFNDLADSFLYYGWNNVQVSNMSANGFEFEYFEVNSNEFYELHRRNETSSVNGNTVLITRDSVMYVYVDKDVTVSGKGKALGNGYSTKDLNLAFKAGWNAMHWNQVITVNKANYASTQITTITLGNPDNLRWLLMSWDSGGVDTWSNVTSLSQLNGTWKGDSVSTTVTMQEYYGMTDAEWAGSTEAGTFGNDMTIIGSAESTLTVNATTKNVSAFTKITMVFSGSKIATAWADIKNMFTLGNGDPFFEFNDIQHSMTMATSFSGPMSDEYIEEMLSSLQINQNGTKIRNADPNSQSSGLVISNSRVEYYIATLTKQ